MNGCQLKELLSSRLDKTAWMRQNANRNNIESGVRLEPLLQQIQCVVEQRVQLIAYRAEINAFETKVEDWHEDSKKLLNLYLHLNSQDPKDPKRFLFKFCNEVYKTSLKRVNVLSQIPLYAQMLTPQEVLFNTWELIGQVVFLADKIPGKLAAGIDAHPMRIDGSILFINEKLREEFEKITNGLILQNNLAASFTTKEDQQALCVDVSKEIAKMLLTSAGDLNFGLLISMKKYFFPLISIPISLWKWNQRLGSLLKCVNSSLENHLNQVEIPDEKETRCHRMICADLNLHPDTKLTKLHCKQEVLGAIFNLTNAPSLNSYLKIAQVINVEDQFLQNTCKDLIELLGKGYLTRTICDKKEHFFFESAVFDPILLDKFTLFKDGCISEYQSAPFWKCPNLIAACRLMGVDDLDQCKDALLEQIFLFDDQPKEMSWDKLIQKYAEQIPMRSLEETLSLGRYGFSKRSHRLLQACEAALYAVGQAQPDDLIRSKIQHVVMRALSKTFISQKLQFKSLYHMGLIEQIKAIYKRTLNDSICLVYHPAISYQYFDEELFLPGFNLHHRDLNNLTQKGVRIATPEQMMLWLDKVVDTLKARGGQITASEEDQKVLASVISALYERIQEEDFLAEVIVSYDQNIIEKLDPIASYKNFKRTPMTTLQCEKPWGVSALEMNQNFIPHYLAIRPNNPRELLQWLLDFAKWNDKFKSIPIEGNFLNAKEKIIFEKGALKSWFENDITAAQWIEKKIVIPGRGISQEVINEEEILCFSQGAKKWLQQCLTNEQFLETEIDVDLLFKMLCSKKHTLQSFAQHSLLAFESIDKLSLKQKKEIPLIWDSMLLQSLSQKNLEKLKGSCVSFVKYTDTINSKKQFLSCFLNLRTEEIELASISKETMQIVPFGKWDGIK